MRIKLSELEKWKSVEEAGEVPEDVGGLVLKDTPPAAAEPEPGALNNVPDLKNQITTFTTSFHKRAAQLTSWINTLEGKPELSERETKPLGR